MMSYDGELVRQAGVRRAVRIRAVQTEGFTPRQAAFLVDVMVHGGVFLERQYCTFAGITHGQKTHDFLRRLTERGFAREIRPGALHRGRFYHVHHKRLYAAIREPDNRNRRRAPIGALASRLMLIDLVLDDTSRTWLGAHDDKVAYFTGLSRDVELKPADLPHIPFGTGRRRVLRTFPDKLPIGVPTDTYDHVFTYLVTRRQPVDFRAFLVRHFMLWARLHECTLRIAFPRELHDVMGVYRRAVREELFSPMHPHDSNEFEWYCGERLRREREPSTPPEPRFREAERRFRSARMSILYRLYRQYGAGFLINLWSPMLQDKLQRGLMKVEFVPLTRQYLHLSPLVGVA